MNLKVELLSTLAAVSTIALGGIAQAEVVSGNNHGLSVVFGEGGLGFKTGFTHPYFGIGPRPLGFMPGFGVPIGGFPSGFTPPGFGFNPPPLGGYSDYALPGLGINSPLFGVGSWGVSQGNAMPAALQQVSGVHCLFGSEGLLAATVDSCENAGGAVEPSQMSYTVKCSIDGEMVMTPSSKSCVRIGGKLASAK